MSGDLIPSWEHPGQQRQHQPTAQDGPSRFDSGSSSLKDRSINSGSGRPGSSGGSISGSCKLKDPPPLSSIEIGLKSEEKKSPPNSSQFQYTRRKTTGDIPCRPFPVVLELGEEPYNSADRDSTTCEETRSNSSSESPSMSGSSKRNPMPMPDRSSLKEPSPPSNKDRYDPYQSRQSSRSSSNNSPRRYGDDEQPPPLAPFSKHVEEDDYYGRERREDSRYREQQDEEDRRRGGHGDVVIVDDNHAGRYHEPRYGGGYSPGRGGGDYPPRGGGDYPPRGGGDYPPRGGGDYPRRGGDYPPRGGGDYPPPGRHYDEDRSGRSNRHPDERSYYDEDRSHRGGRGYHPEDRRYPGPPPPSPPSSGQSIGGGSHHSRQSNHQHEMSISHLSRYTMDRATGYHHPRGRDRYDRYDEPRDRDRYYDRPPPPQQYPRGYDDERSRYGDDRPRYGGDDRYRYSERDRYGDERSRYDDRSRYGGDDRSRYGGDDRSRYGGDDRSRYGEERPRYYNDDRSRYGGDDRSRGGDDRSRHGGGGDDASTIVSNYSRGGGGRDRHGEEPYPPNRRYEQEDSYGRRPPPPEYSRPPSDLHGPSGHSPGSYNSRDNYPPPRRGDGYDGPRPGAAPVAAAAAAPSRDDDAYEAKMRAFGFKDDGSAAPPSSQESDVYVDIGCGVKAKLRRTKETMDAIAREFYAPATCFACCTELYCIADVKYIVCPICKTVSPAEAIAGPGAVQFDGVPLRRHGVGLGFTYETLCRMQAEVSPNKRGDQRFKSGY